MLTRRAFVGSVAILPLAPVGASRLQPEASFDAIHATLGPGARLGVAAIDTGTGKRIGYDENGCYAMCSTFKHLLAAHVLRLAELRKLTLADELRFGAGDLLVNSPVVEANLRRGRLTIRELAAAAVRHSDNSAANLLRRTGGPQGLTGFLRSCGDRVTRLDRYELELNSNGPGDVRDTTTPAAMAAVTALLVLGRKLAPASRERLAGWLQTSTRFPDRLRAGFPSNWKVGHKPGTGRNGALNDVAIAWPPGRAPIVIASYISSGGATAESRSAAHRAAAAAVLRQLS